MTIADLIARWGGTEGGAERANYQMFLSELTQALGMPLPEPKAVGLGGYEFEAPVRSEAALGRKGTGRIDLYKRDCFILEAKQSQLKPGEPAPPEPAAPAPEPIRDLFGAITGYGAAARAAPRYDRLMADARLQAERYALALPGDHKAPPFLIVADIGRAFELYFDWSGNGRGYRPFPDERGYRIALADLASDAPIAGVEETAADTLRAIWADPGRIDPRTRSARVTRDIATRLSRVAAQLEKDQRDLRPGDAEIALGIEATSLFLMRTLFCMFAEDVGLLPKDSFKTFLSDAEGRSGHFWRRGLEDLWSRMNDPQEANRYWSQGDAIVRYFNGNLFSGARVYDLPAEFKRELRVAADQDWRAVEPAIFGTLLEQVLTPSERAKLGAHYTPRPYVQRLVQATIMDVLTPEWEVALAEAREAADAGDTASAIARARAFHDRLTAIRILDPACGTGNFLYVAMENLLGLESLVRQFVVGLGGTLAPAIHPNQFLGLELNPRAAVIAELVLWIGWLRYRLANTPDAIGEPVLPPLSNINGGTPNKSLGGGFDAVLVRTATGEPDVENPRRPEWPEADFIVGNPPFIGGKDIRDRLGGSYAETLWRANPRVPKSADFVMHWWDRAADILTREGSRLRRFGFVTTNSITQVFSRRVIEAWLAPSPLPPAGGVGGGVVDEPPSSDDIPSPSPSREREGDKMRKLHLTLAIADHPWTRVTRDAAAVRIAMTVAEAGEGEGRLLRVVKVEGLDSDDPLIDTEQSTGRLNARLSLRDWMEQPKRLSSNVSLRSRGVEFHGDGYVLSAKEFQSLSVENEEFYKANVKPYIALRDIKSGRLNRHVADLFYFSERDIRQSTPNLYQRLLKLAKPSRDDNSVPWRRENWWKLALPHIDLREGLDASTTYIATGMTTKHRWYSLEEASAMPDQSLVAIFGDTALAGILSTRLHDEWFVEFCGWLGVGNDPRYNPRTVFDTFPFPILDDRSTETISELFGELDQTRKTALAESPSLTMTGLYNFVAAIRDGTLAEKDEAAAVRARARIVAKLHDDLDAAVAAAYGWEWPLPAQEIVARLVALNAERAAEEAAGTVRWLRPDYQIPRFGKG